MLEVQRGVKKLQMYYKLNINYLERLKEINRAAQRLTHDCIIMQCHLNFSPPTMKLFLI